MAKFGFIGPTYTSQAKAADGERCINLYPEVVESGHGKSPCFLARRPGLRLRVPLPDAPSRSLYSGDGQTVFAVAGSTLFEITKRTPPANPQGAGLRTALILASGSTPDAFPLPAYSATQWGTWYGAVTGMNVPLPATYGFLVGDGAWYAPAALVTVDQWLDAFFSTDSYITLGAVPPGSNPARMFANRNSLFIASAGQGFLVNGGAPYSVVPALMGGFVDGYLLALQPDGLSIQFSALYDGTTWNGLSFFSPTGEPDAVLSILVANREVWCFKQQSTEIYDDVGDPNYVFLRSGGGFIEQGIVAPWSAVRLDNTVFWLGGDERGAGVVWRAMGYTPIRVSNHAFETAVQGYSRIDDAEAWGMQWGGHSFYVIHFPSANNGNGATWVYDCAASAQLGKAQWMEWLQWDSVHGLWKKWQARCHCYARMTHYVGDGTTGNIYSLEKECGTDDRNPIRWLRSAPHSANSMEPVFYRDLRLDLQLGKGLNDNIVEDQGPSNIAATAAAGGLELSTLTNAQLATLTNAQLAALGNSPGGSGGSVQLGVAGKAPVVVMRMSNDGGNTWGNEHTKSCGMIGQYKARARWAYSLGWSFDRCFEISGSDPVETYLVECDVEAGA